MDKIGKIWIMFFVMLLVSTMTYAAVGVTREDKVINVTIKDSGDIVYKDVRIDKRYERRIISNGEMRLKLNIEVPATYMGCAEWVDTLTSDGQPWKECANEYEMNYTDEEINDMLTKKTRERMLDINQTLDRRARETEVVVREGEIGDGGRR